MTLGLGYLVPEFPGQTHVFFCGDFRFNAPLALSGVLSTRKPSPLPVGTKSFRSALAQTHYLFPPSLASQCGLDQAAACRDWPGRARYLRELSSSGLKASSGVTGCWRRLLTSSSGPGSSASIISTATRAPMRLMCSRSPTGMGGPPYSLTLHVTWKSTVPTTIQNEAGRVRECRRRAFAPPGAANKLQCPQIVSS